MKYAIGMKRPLYVGVSVGALMLAASSAFAADLAVKAPIMRAPVAVASWTGCYVGGHLGWGWSRHRVNETGFDSSSTNVATSGNIDSSGAMFGGQVGCNYQFNGNWVVGVEGMGAATDFHGSNLNPIDVIGLHDLDNYNTVKTDWLASVTGRVGMSYNEVLYYVKGGGAWVRNRWNVSDTFTGDPSSLPGIFSEQLRTKTGWTVGAGAEWMWSFAPKWSTFVEYDYYDFGNTNLFVQPPGSGSTTFTMDAKQTIHTVKVGLNYRLFQ